MSLHTVGFFLALCTTVCSNVAHPQRTRQSSSFRAFVPAQEPSMAMLMTGSATERDTAFNPLGDAAAGHAKNYAMLAIIVIGCIVVCCCLVGLGGAVAVGAVVYAILNDPFIKLSMEQREKEEELPDEVKIHVRSEEFAAWCEKMFEEFKNSGKTLTEVVQTKFGAELAKDAFYAKTVGMEKVQKDKDWKAWHLHIVFVYFETLQFIKFKKISLTKLGVKLPPKPVSVENIQKMRKSIQADLPDNIQRHVNSYEFAEFCMKHFMEQYSANPLPGQSVSMQAVAQAVQKAFPTEELIQDVTQLQSQLEANAKMDAECFREVFMYFECLMYKKLKMVSLDKPGVRVPKDYKAEKAAPPPTVEEQAPSGPAAIQDA